MTHACLLFHLLDGLLVGWVACKLLACLFGRVQGERIGPAKV